MSNTIFTKVFSSQNIHKCKIRESERDAILLQTEKMEKRIIKGEGRRRNIKNQKIGQIFYKRRTEENFLCRTVIP